MKNDQAVLDRVRAIVSEQANVPLSAVTDQTALRSSSLDLDSLDVIEIQMELEDHFMIQIPDEEFYHLKTVEEVAKLVASKAYS
jgi:acyl carrier protein